MSSFPPTRLSATPSRRGFLKATAAGLAGISVFPPGMLYAQARVVSLESYAPEFFSAEEWTFVRAAVSRLIPSDGPGPGAIEAHVPIFLDLQLGGDYGRADDWYMQGPHDPSAPPELGWQTPLGPAALYRAAIAAFDTWCRAEHGGIFADLTPEDQDAALAALEDGEVPLPPELRDFFDTLLLNTKEGYFSDPIHGGNHGMLAWSHIGFPGARANFREWVERHNVAYPLGPVSIRGERA